MQLNTLNPTTQLGLHKERNVTIMSVADFIQSLRRMLQSGTTQTESQRKTQSISQCRKSQKNSRICLMSCPAFPDRCWPTGADGRERTTPLRLAFSYCRQCRADVISGRIGATRELSCGECTDPGEPLIIKVALSIKIQRSSTLHSESDAGDMLLHSQLHEGRNRCSATVWNADFRTPLT